MCTSSKGFSAIAAIMIMALKEKAEAEA